MQAVQQPSTAECTGTIAPVPSGSYISYQHATEYGSAFHQVQALRTRVSKRAWEGAPAPSHPLCLPQRLSSVKLRRLESLLKKFGTASHLAPAQVC